MGFTSVCFYNNNRIGAK